MTIADIPGVIPLIEQLGYPCSHESLTARFEEFEARKDKDSTVLLIGDVSGSIVAFMQLGRIATLVSKKRAEIQALVVDERHRGQGVGRKMILAAEDWSRHNQLENLRLGSRSTRTDAHRFYEKSGFSIEKTWLVFTKDLRAR